MDRRRAARELLDQLAVMNIATAGDASAWRSKVKQLNQRATETSEPCLE